MRGLLNVWAWLVALVLMLTGLPLMALVFAVTVPFDRRRLVVGRLFRLLGVVAVRCNPLWRFDAVGGARPSAGRPFVAVANHESYIDTFLIAHLPWEMKWMGKEELFAIPLFGWMMAMAGDIKLRRGDWTSAFEALETARGWLDRGVGVMIFPEGTRSRDGSPLPFRDGAFHLAVDAGVPILPLALVGTRSAMPADSPWFGRSRARVRVLPVVETTGLTTADVPALRERVRTMILAARAELARELASPAAT